MEPDLLSNAEVDVEYGYNSERSWRYSIRAHNAGTWLEYVGMLLISQYSIYREQQKIITNMQKLTLYLCEENSNYIFNQSNLRE